MTEALQRLRCAKCGEYYWGNERHHCRARGQLVLARPRRPRVEFDPRQARHVPRAPLGLPEPGGEAGAQPAPIDSTVLQQRLDALESQIDQLKRASDHLRGNDSQYEMALELLVREVVQLKDRLGQAHAAAGSPATSDPETFAAHKPRRRMRRPSSPPRRRTAALMMWVFALLLVAGGLAGLVLARMPG